MTKPIRNQAIKLACIQALPGKEFQVANELSKACKKYKLRPYALLKGFGTFDIILLYTNPSFESQLTKTGPIEGILKYNLFFCYTYRSDIFKILSKNPFTGFSLLKIDPGVQHRFPDVERQVFDYLKNKIKASGSVLGTLGWNEIILMISSDQIKVICQDLLSISNLILRMEEKDAALLIKTFSFISINYDKLPRDEDTLDEIGKLKAFFKDEPSLKETLSKEFSTSIAITTEPVYIGEIAEYWKQMNFDVKSMLGKHDLLLTPKKNISWSSLLTLLLHFRYRFKNKILSTNTLIEGFPPLPKKSKTEKIPFNTPIIDYDFDELEAIFNKDSAVILANHFNALNCLSQNPVIGSAFQDMSAYPEYIKRTGKKLKEKKINNLDFAAACSQWLRFGADLRFYGAYGTVEEVVGQFSKMRGGAQRAMLALEFLPSYIFDKRLGGTWEGFIITTGLKFYHSNEIIGVTTDALWDPLQWWALYHEIAHIFITQYDDGKFISAEIQEIKQFLADKDHHDYWLKLLRELAAEVIGYELGFYGDYDLYMNSLWNHLKQVIPVASGNIPLDLYLVRTFFVELFDSCFRDLTLTEHQYKNADYLYPKFLDHIEAVKKITRLPFDEKYFVAATNVKTLSELFLFSKYLFTTISTLQLGRPKDDLTNETVLKASNTIEKGRVFWDPLDLPEALLYLLMKKGSLKFSQSIATILTFWNLQMTKSQGVS